MRLSREYRKLQAFTEHQMEGMLAYFTERGWKSLGPPQVIQPESYYKLARVELVIYLDTPAAPAVPQGAGRAATSESDADQHPG